MSIKPDQTKIFFLNPYDIKGGAALGTFRLFSYFRRYIDSRSCLCVVVKNSENQPGIFGLSAFFKSIFYLQAFFNKLVCRILSTTNLPVAFTFFVPVSLPALALFYRSRSSLSLYLHSMGSGFSCPVSFYLLLRKARVVKTADDWYLTGGCHYSLDCDQWTSGCKSCPHVSLLGKIVVRLNWLIKRKILSSSFGFTFVSPSSWLSARYQVLYPQKCTVIYNSAFHNDSRDSTASSPALINPTQPRAEVSPSNKSLVTFGLPVTYLRDKRKGFDASLPVILQLLECYPVRLLLCGGDADIYRASILSNLSSLHPNAKVDSLGYLKPAHMSAFYSSLDFMLHFAKYDNSPNVVSESLCCGIPVIVLDHAGSPEHVRSSSAGFVLKEIDELLSIMRQIEQGTVNIPLLKSLAIQYSEAVLSPESMARSYSNLLSDH